MSSINKLKWPNEDSLTGRAKTRLRELKRMTDWHTYSEQELKIIQEEINLLATKIKGNPEQE